MLLSKHRTRDCKGHLPAPFRLSLAEETHQFVPRDAKPWRKGCRRVAEQAVKVVDETISDSIRGVQYRDLDGGIRQMPPLPLARFSSWSASYSLTP